MGMRFFWVSVLLVGCVNQPPSSDVIDDVGVDVPTYDACASSSNCTTEDEILCGAGGARVCSVDPVTGCLMLGVAESCAVEGPCEVGSCSDVIGCVISPAPDETACDDGDACTVSDMCSPAGACAGTERDCDDVDVCTDDSCDPGVGCQYAATTALCDDGNACTKEDSCKGGVCVGLFGGLDCDDDNACTRDLCDLEEGCNYLPLSNVSCDDGQVSSRNDGCVDGECVGETYACTPLQCQETSVPNGVDCDVTLKVTGTVCDDGDAATRDDACSPEGACVGVKYDCAPTQCEATSDADGAGCVVTWHPAETACDDGEVATQDDVCDGAGVCAGVAYSCVAGPCDESSVPNGADCDVVVKAAGTGCDDVDASTDRWGGV